MTVLLALLIGMMIDVIVRYQVRKARGLTQADLADAAGVSRQTIVSVEKGHFDPSLPLAFRLASIFECQIEDIFSPDEP